MHSNDILSETYISAIEDEIHKTINLAKSHNLEEYVDMMEYHLGWSGESIGYRATGKRIRPLLVLLTCKAAGGKWEQALPACAAVELIHNFSLIHDDIQDNSDFRRGRLTVWKKWGIAQAINAGDSMFTLAFMALNRLQETTTPEITLKAMHILQQACLQLTQGQYMDMAYQKRGDLDLPAYWPMVSGKTAALISACTQLGAFIAGNPQHICDSYRKFGYLLGLAFQVQDDYLGIWGNASLTGKSSESDLLMGKKSLPVLYGLSQQARFAQRWNQGPIQPAEVSELAKLLEIEGGRTFTSNTTEDLTRQSLECLTEAKPENEAGKELLDLTSKLLTRQA
jgi:geranylgeranyl diphosphate synthase, type I